MNITKQATLVSIIAIAFPLVLVLSSIENNTFQFNIKISDLESPVFIIGLLFIPVLAVPFYLWGNAINGLGWNPLRYKEIQNRRDKCLFETLSLLACDDRKMLRELQDQFADKIKRGNLEK